MKQPNPAYYKQEISESLKNYFFDRASPTDTKRTIMTRVSTEIEDMEKRGERFFALLFFRLAREGAKLMTYGAKQPEEPIFMAVIGETKDLWDTDPEFREARALVEEL